ncbi:hypothetical protein [Sphingobacterium haloxyli]|uniref:Lipid A biosynthesis acyltransferase n=1 Tax=Sphingobacterium haloxyli TaxID=2100533 RepID=A0A2S9IYC8_9SPHI|nr:hypothetical protein [Sphingobacterium haloxyli]PRD45536.1 hypothetical protein C5745_17640 [Sphingobacterium haloxyli]
MYTFNSWSFALFSANLHRYLPKLDWPQHETVYINWKDHHRKKPLDELLNKREIDVQVLESFRDPAIITLFHLGDHLVWPVLLAQNGIRFNVILDRVVYLDAKGLFDQLLIKLGAYGHAPELLFSDDRALLLKIRSRIADGQHLLCFADGASGSETVKKDERLPIRFLEGTLWLKKGIPFISHLFDMPVISLLPQGIGDIEQLQFHKTILPVSYEDREVYLLRCLQQLYGSLEKKIKNEPHLWECWGYLHQNGMLGKIVDNQIFNDISATVQVVWDDKMVTFDRLNYTVRRE